MGDETRRLTVTKHRRSEGNDTYITKAHLQCNWMH
jgi:hypothetical protein